MADNELIQSHLCRDLQVVILNTQTVKLWNYLACFVVVWIFESYARQAPPSMTQLHYFAFAHSVFRLLHQVFLSRETFLKWQSF